MSRINGHFTTVFFFHRHWGRTLFCLSVLSLLFVVFFTTNVIHADQIDVSATVPAPLPTSPAIITSPADQSRFSAPEVTIKGTCPEYGAYVILYRSGAPIGTAPCQNGTFELPISLIPGANVIEAHIYNVTDGEGPVSSPLTLYYDVPSKPEPLFPIFTLPFLTPPTPAPSAGGFFLSYQYRYQVRNQGEPWQWEIGVHGGTSPYRIRIDWGDGKANSFDFSGGNSFNLTHTYDQAGTFTPLIRATDSEGRIASLQLLAVVNPAPINEEKNAVAASSDQVIPSYVLLLVPMTVILVVAVIKTFLASTISAIRGPTKKP